MFVFKKERAFDWPVEVLLPEDGGKERVEKFTVRFSISSEALGDAALTEDFAEEETARERLSRMIIGWDGIKTEDGGDLPFGPINLEALLRDPFVVAGIAKALAECLSGARAKNFARRPRTGLMS